MPRQAGINPIDGTSMSPEAYRMTATIVGANGREREIQNIITRFVVYESIFQQALMAEIDIADGISMMEDLDITGNEKISIIISKQSFKNSPVENLQSDWYVLDIPLFSRPKPDIQVYTIRCVSASGLVSKFRRVSNVFSGTPIEILEALYSNIGIEAEVVSRQSLGVMKYIPPRLTYSDAIANVLRKTMTPNGTPYFAYQKFYDGKHIIKSYYDMINEDSLDVYNQNYFYTAEAQEHKGFEEKRRRILEVGSKLGFSPYKSMKNGSYVTRTHNLDLSTKSYTYFDYNAFKDKPPMIDANESELVWNEQFDVSSLSPNNLKEVYNIYFSTNVYAMIESNEYNVHQFLPYKEAIRKSIYSNLEQIEHTIKLHGDTRVVPGSIIELQFPKIGLIDESNIGGPDPFLSGRYLVVSNTHTFSNDGYYMSLKVRRDSVHKRS